MRTISIVGVLALALAAMPAAAAPYSFSFASTSTLFGSPPISGSGIFTTSDVATQIGGETAFAITGISGSVNGDAITGLFAAPGNPTYYYFTTGPTFLDGSGVRFNAGAATNIAFFAQSTVLPPANPYRVNGDGTILATVTATSGLVAAVPEAATWAMMMAGIGAIGTSLRRRRSVAKVRMAFA